MMRRVAAYWALLGGEAPRCAPGDYRTAARFVARIERAIERGGWSKSEVRNLQMLYDVWAARANGMDPRFDLLGNKAGRLPRDQESWIVKRRKVFEMREYLRLAQVVQSVNALNPAVRPAPSTMRRRALRK